ncbi:MAG: hypothetical protein JRN09_01805 [Nitrososphaerota archaeon]|nr:hypothetical protein [Nitrososphaerota archaeon]
MKIILGTFKDNGDELAEFLGPRVGDKPSVSGGEINWNDEDVKKTIKSKHVKTYIKRYLNRKGERANYQILVEGKELRLIEIEHDEEEKEEKKKAPTQPEEKAEEAIATQPALEAKEEAETEKKEEAPAAEVEEPAKPKKARKPSQKKPSASPSS